jgi:hypothetical protein
LHAEAKLLQFRDGKVAFFAWCAVGIEARTEKKKEKGVTVTLMMLPMTSTLGHPARLFSLR